MNIKVHSSELNRIMKTMTQCINQQLPSYSNIEISHNNNLLTIRGTNGTYQASMSTPLLGGDGESFCVDGNMFAKVCSMCNGEISISTDGKVCTIKGAGRTRIPIVNADIPAQNHVKGTSSVITGEDLANAFNGVSYAVSSDQSRIQLTGVYCQFGEYGVKMVSLDGFQMSIETAKCTGEVMNVIIPGQFLKLIVQASIPEESITFFTNGTRIEVVSDSMNIVCGLLVGEYPDYNRILPREFKTECIVNVEEFRNALKCGSIIASKQNLVKLAVGMKNISIMSNSEEADYDADVACDTHGDPLVIAFNQKYLMSSINTITDEEAILKFNSSVTPCVIRGKDDNGIRLLLPVRVAG